MQHFRHLDPAVHDALFFRPPKNIPVDADIVSVATALGATLYMPATRTDLTATLIKRSRMGVCSLVIDLEDAVADHDLEEALT
ncbi:MAG: HpcH/HpaI aldolase/citrate lyase family protein, partial [Rhodococcus sp. (in: high G+C Gram-positive bacteria)]